MVEQQQQEQFAMNNNNILRNREVLWGSENPHTFFALSGIIDKVYLLLYLHLRNVFVLFDHKNNLCWGYAIRLFKHLPILDQNMRFPLPNFRPDS